MIMNLLNCFSHIYPGSSKYLPAWHAMLLYFPFRSISPHFSFSNWFGSFLSQRHVPVEPSLTYAFLLLNQNHELFPATVSKPMNQRLFVRFLVKFMTKCHSFSVSIETSEPFSWSRHFSLASLQLILSSWKLYLEQTVTNVYGKPTEKRKTMKNDQFTYLLIVYIIQELDKVTQKENWIKPSDTDESFLHLLWCSRDWLNETVNFQD